VFDSWTLNGDAAIRITRDAHGVPHVRAATERDLYRGLGYCHGRDRGLQMLLVRILGQGRACEILQDSEELFELDRFFRRLAFTAGSEAEETKLSSEQRSLARAYCDGVDAALRRRAPWELRLLGYKPEPWRIADSVLISRLMGYIALAQSQGDMERLLVELVQAGVPRDHLEALFPGLLAGMDTTLLARVKLGQRLVPETARRSRVLPRAVASNNWVISGRKTASGKPVLANDPHLEANRLPAVWYEIVAELGDRFCIAATIPGLPAFLLGRTNDLAWGATYAFMDAIDSWVEDCREGCFRRVVDGEETWVSFRRRNETIERRKHPAVTLTFHENDHGVLDGDPAEPGLYLTTRWSGGGDTGAASLASMFGLLHASDVGSGMALLGNVETAWNWVLADSQGNIGYQMSGRMPLRRPGVSGLLPLKGWDPEDDWRGFATPGDLPRALNPETGFIVTANNDLNHLGRLQPINLPMGSYRADRIAQLLAARDDWTAAETQRMQMDVYSLQAACFMEVLRPLLPEQAEASVLRDWDCRYDLDSLGADLFERFYRELVVEVFSPPCGAEVVRFLTRETGILIDFYRNFDEVLLDAHGVWFGAEGRDAVFRRVAARVLENLPSPWGSRRFLWMRHVLFGGKLPLWLGFDHGPIPLRGGRATVHQGQTYRSGGRDTSFAPSYRLVTDLGEPAAHTTLAGGPSDRRFSRWYTTGIADWAAGRFKVLRSGEHAD